ncbi:MAG: hypothetical protein WC729_15670 [Sphingomonas sp.]|jgi:hypothetical protein|uniref:hypothetical protein n=1 Tax=Sphingomonas sp. TaxID=28214 RepID=UPI0035626A23
MSRRTAIGWAAVGAGVSAAVLLGLAPMRNATETAEGKNPSADRPTATASSARDGEVRLERAEQQRTGLSVASVTTTSTPAITHGFARGLDGGALAAIDAEIVTARAAAGASRAEAARLVQLFSQDQSASAKSVEAARAQSAADSARVGLAERRIGLEYGPGLARLGTGARHALIADIAAGRAALVRIDVPGASLDTRSRMRIDGGVLAVLGPAAAADPRLQSAGLLAILRGPIAASATNGRILDVKVERGSAEAGVAVPRDAVLRWRGGLWVYRQDGPESFERVELIDARPIGGAWFVHSGLTAGNRVVTGGAETLLAIDRSGGSAAESDGD